MGKAGSTLSPHPTHPVEKGRQWGRVIDGKMLEVEGVSGVGY